MDYLWLLLLVPLIAIFVAVDYFLGRAFGRSAVDFILWGASKAKILRPDLNQIEVSKRKEQEPKP